MLPKAVETIAALAMTLVHSAEPTLPGTVALTGNVERSEEMVRGMERYLDGENTGTLVRRVSLWRRDTSSAEAYASSVEPNRDRFRKLIGAVEARVVNPEPHYVSQKGVPAKIGESELFTAYAVRWPVYHDVEAEGLLLEPKGEVKARVVALSDADQTPEQICGLTGGLAVPAQWARRLAENGCQVLIPTLVSRDSTHSNSASAGRATNRSGPIWHAPKRFA